MDGGIVALIGVSMGGSVALLGVIGWIITTNARTKALAKEQGDPVDFERIEELEGRVAELEERVDFSERLLADRRRQDTSG